MDDRVQLMSPSRDSHRRHVAASHYTVTAIYLHVFCSATCLISRVSIAASLLSLCFSVSFAVLQSFSLFLFVLHMLAFFFFFFFLSNPPPPDFPLFPHPAPLPS